MRFFNNKLILDFVDYCFTERLGQHILKVQGSGMPSIYVHLSGRDIDDAVLKANGIVQKDVSTPNVQKETERLSLHDNSPKLDISSIIEAKVGKLVEAKIAELLGS